MHQSIRKRRHCKVIAFLALSRHTTKPQRASRGQGKPWLAKGQKSHWPVILLLTQVISHVWRDAAHTPDMCYLACFQCACSWYVTHLSSPLLRYTMRGDTALVCEACKVSSSRVADTRTKPHFPQLSQTSGLRTGTFLVLSYLIESVLWLVGLVSAFFDWMRQQV